MKSHAPQLPAPFAVWGAQQHPKTLPSLLLVIAEPPRPLPCRQPTVNAPGWRSAAHGSARRLVGSRVTQQLESPVHTRLGGHAAAQQGPQLASHATHVRSVGGHRQHGGVGAGPECAQVPVGHRQAPAAGAAAGACNVRRRPLGAPVHSCVAAPAAYRHKRARWRCCCCRRMPAKAARTWRRVTHSAPQRSCSLPLPPAPLWCGRALSVARGAASPLVASRLQTLCAGGG